MKKILSLMMMMLVIVFVTSCSKNATKEDSKSMGHASMANKSMGHASMADKSMGHASMAYSKKAKASGVSAPTMTGKKNSVSSMLSNDSIGMPTKHKIPNSCVTTNKTVISKGKFLYNNARGKSVKKPPHNISRTMKKTDPGYVAERQKWKPYGNCVACHNTAGAKSPGNIGPSLVNYKNNFIKTKVRTTAWMFEKISDPRVDNPNTVMTVNHTTFSPNEICAMMSFVLNGK